MNCHAMIKRNALLLYLLVGSLSTMVAQTPTTFEGIDASQLTNPQLDIDPNGAVGTKQYLEWVNVAYQAFDKTSFAPVWSKPQAGTTPWKNAGLTSCTNINGDGIVLFDRLASRWVIAGRSQSLGVYYFCVAISNTDDLSSSSLNWFTYAFALNSILGKNQQGTVYFPDWPKLATWSDAYYLTIDLEDSNNSFKEVGVVACALDRANMLTGGTPRAQQCFRDASSGNNIYLAHSLIPTDVDGTTAPPAGRDQYMFSIQNPVNDGVSKTSTSFNIWDFHLDWTSPANSTFTQTTQSVASYTPGCYNAASPANTICVPDATSATSGKSLDSVGDRFMPRASYRNFGSYESFLVSHTLQVGTGSSKQTGIRWYELRGSGTPALFQDGNVSPDSSLFRFMPSIAQDSAGEAAVGYSVSSSSTHPGMNASWWSLASLTAPSEFSIFSGSGDEQNGSQWGDYTSMTVDPVDGCTFWYVNEYLSQNQTGSQHIWKTRISNFQLPGCQGVTLLPASGLSFGSIAQGNKSAAQNATLMNGQSVSLNINSIGFVGTNPSDFSETDTCGSRLAAGANCTISVVFTPAALGSRSATLKVVDDSASGSETIPVSGTGIVPVSLSSTSLNFGNVVIGTSSTAPAVTLTNNQNVALTGISISAAAPFSQTNTCGSSVPAGGTCKITITFSPTITGVQSGTVSITDSASNSPQTIAVKGTGVNPVTFNPGSLNFGTVAVGTSSTPMNTVLTNRQKVALSVTSISITGPNAGDYSQTNNCPASVPAGGTCTIAVTFTPHAAGTRNANVRVVDNASTSPQTVRLTGVGQ